MPDTNPILIFDLDGTLLSVNSFPHWVRYMLTGKFGGLSLTERLALSLSTAKILAERKLLGTEHGIIKNRLQSLWAEALEKDDAELALHLFTASLQRYVRRNLHAVVTADAILATSAAGEYAQAMGKALGFTHILTTPRCGDIDRLENSKERKRDRVLGALLAQGWDARPRIFFTDHAEDLPLIRECRRTLWFGSESAMDAAKAHAPEADIIFCRDSADTEITKLLSL